MDFLTQNVTNSGLSVLMAGSMAYVWWRHRELEAFRYWMIGALSFVVADLLFAMRPRLPILLDPVLSTAAVTFGYLFVLFGIWRFVDEAPRTTLAIALGVAHAVALAALVFFGASVEVRVVVNSVVWAILTATAMLSLTAARARLGESVVMLPSIVCGIQVVVMGARVVIATSAIQQWSAGAAFERLVSLSLLETSLFIVAIFMSLLIAEMLRRQAALQKALTDVSVLSGMLPICAWCKKVRDDQGYWNQLERFIASHTPVDFTHGICPDCAAQHMAEGKDAAHD